VELVVVLIGLELRDLLLPIGVEDVAVVAREALIDILPRADEQLWVGGVALGGNLGRGAVVAALGGIVQRVHAISVIATRRSACLAHLLLAVAL